MTESGLFDEIYQTRAFEKNEIGFCVNEFMITLGKLDPAPIENFSFDVPTTKQNLYRVARAMLSAKPIMLEGSPGAGKSSLIVALAAATGNSLIRLNLSEQTVNLFYFFNSLFDF